MKTILINGTQTSIETSQVPLEVVLQEINKSGAPNMVAVSNVKIDGKDIDEDQQAIFQTNIDSLDEIEIFTSNPADLAQETLSTLELYVDRIMQNIERASQAYTAKNFVTADSYFARCVDGLDLFVQTIGSIKMALRTGLNSKIGLTEATLVSIMNDLLEAKRQNNYVLLADLLEKDLLENLKEWKEVIFPIFINWKTS